MDGGSRIRRSLSEKPREVEVRILRQRRSKIRSNRGSSAIRIARRKRAVRSRVANHQALTDQHHHDEHHEADADSPVEAAVPAHGEGRTHTHPSCTANVAEVLGGPVVRFMFLTKFPNICRSE